MKELHDKEYYRLIKEFNEVKDLLSEVLRRLGKIEYTGEVEFGDPYHIGRSKKQVSVTLRREEDDETLIKKVKPKKPKKFKKQSGRYIGLKK
tara:strand:- start:76 stop:351 length:276 start_codon:yes stop_codon:yes gene_type:complete